MRSSIANGAPVSPTTLQQFAELGAKYKEVVGTIDQTKPPEAYTLAMLTFLRLQMIDLKIDMLAMRLGAAKDPDAPRIVVPGRGH